MGPLLCTGMGYVGAALASSISTWMQFLLLVVYIKFFKVRHGTTHAVHMLSPCPVSCRTGKLTFQPDWQTNVSMTMRIRWQSFPCLSQNTDVMVNIQNSLRISLACLQTCKDVRLSISKIGSSCMRKEHSHRCTHAHIYTHIQDLMLCK